MVRKSKLAQEMNEAASADEFVERRKSARLDIPLRVQYKVIAGRELPSEGSAVTRNVSPGGCLLLATEDIPLDSMVELKLFLGEKEEEALILGGKIMRLNREEGNVHEYGIAFDGMSAEARRLFADFCFARMYEMVGLTNWPTARGPKTETGNQKPENNR